MSTGSNLPRNLIFCLFCILFFIGRGYAQQKTKIADDSLNQLLTAEIQAKYFQVKPFHNGRAAFHGKNCSWGYLDENLNELIPAIFDFALDFNSHGFAKVQLKRGAAYIDKAGNLLTTIAGNVSSTNRGDFAILKTFNPKTAVLYDIKNQKRLTKTNTYNNIEQIGTNFFIYSIGLRHGLMDEHGQAIIEPRYHYIFKSWSKSIYEGGIEKVSYYQVEINGSYGLIDSLGKEIIPLKYKDAKIFGNYPLFALQDPKTKLWGILNDKNEIILPFRYSQEAVYSIVLTKDLIFILEEDHMLAYDHLGLRIKDYEKNAKIFSIDNATVLKWKDDNYLLDAQGEITSDAYHRIDPFGDSLFKVEFDNKYGLCDKTGKLVRALEYRSIFRSGQFYNMAKGVFFAKTAKGTQVLNKAGEILLPYFFDKESGLNDSIIIFSNKELALLYNVNNKDQKIIEKRKNVRLINNYNLIAIEKEQGWALINTADMSLEIACDSFYNIDLVNENSTYYDNIYDNKLFIRKGDHYLEVEADSKTLSPIYFLPIMVYNIKGQDYHKIRKPNQKFNLVRASSKKELFSKDYTVLTLKKRGLFLLENQEGDKGLISLTGEIIIPFKYDLLRVYDEYISAIKKDNTQDCYNSKNELIVLPEDAQWESYYKYNYTKNRIIFKQNGQYGCVNTIGNVVVPAKYDAILFHEGGIIEGKKHLFSNYYNKNGEWIECYRQKSARF